MELLKAEIARKRKANEALVAKLSTADQVTESSENTTSGTRFVRQADLIRAREQEFLEAQRRVDQEREEKRRRREEEERSRSKSNLPSSELGYHKNHQEKGATKKGNDENILSLSTEDVKRRLRAMGHPVTLFGETDSDRRDRLSKVEAEDGGDIEDEFRLNSGNSAEKRGKYSSEHHVADDEDDEDDDEHDEGTAQRKRQRHKQGSSSSAHAEVDMSGGESDNDNDNDNDDRSDKDQGKGGSSRGALSGFDANGNRIQFSKIEPRLAPEKIVYKYFRALLKEWEWDLNKRDESEKMCMKGRTETKMQKQCKDYIRPLFKMCKRKNVDADILEKLVRMVEHCEEGNFRAAHDEYLRTAIGNAAWPIGLTMVGIHERSGREKISTAKVAHVMNNELQRKYLTSVKRLMTFAQNKRPDVPPSMKVLT